MIVKLKILHGKLQSKEGKKVGLDVTIRGPLFVIGSASDCSMRCRSNMISPHHCEIRIEEEGVLIRDLYSETGTFVNGRQVDHERPLQAGDQLRIGRLEFEVLIDQSVASRRPGQPADGQRTSDPVAEYVSDLLVEADEEDRVRRLEDPESRQFHVEGTAPAKAEQQESPPEEAPTKKKRPPKKKPAKLPTPPPFKAENTVEAAEETLKKLFTRGKSK